MKKDQRGNPPLDTVIGALTESERACWRRFAQYAGLPESVKSEQQMLIRRRVILDYRLRKKKERKVTSLEKRER